MASNVSIQRFRALSEKLKGEVRDAAAAELQTQADVFVNTLLAVEPRGATGQLIHSTRKVPGKSRFQVRVVVGSPATVKDGYQYPRADEFGTVHQPAKPFFFPTYRLLKPRMIRTMKRKISASIKKRSAV